MTDLEFVENDADRNFWYDHVGNPVQPCSADPSRRIFSAEKKHWIEIALVDETGNPVPDQDYMIKLPNGTVLTGTLDSRGLARVDGIDPGTCKVAFPSLDGGAWNRFKNLPAKS